MYFLAHRHVTLVARFNFTCLIGEMSCFALLRVYFFTTYGPRFVCVVKYDDTNRHWLIWLMIYTTITTMLVKHLQKPLASIFCGCYAAHPILVASPLAKLNDDVGPLDWTEDKCGDDRQPEFFAGRVCSLVLILFCCKWGYDNYIYIYIHTYIVYIILLPADRQQC